MTPPYIPTQDAEYDAWLTNFAALIAANPTDYGLVAGDATVITAARTLYHGSYQLATNPTTRTSPNIAQKDTDRANTVATVRPYAIQISLNASVDDALKVGVGVNLPNPTRPRIPAPTTNPDLVLVAINPGVATLGYHDATTPLTKAKPVGVVALELRRTIGTAATTNPEAALFVDMITKSPFSVQADAGDVGKIATLWGRWRTKSGPAGIAQVGPWSPALSFAIA